MSKGALEGIRVVDVTQGLAGPFCAMTMAQHGADVIKVEPPEGDWSRTIGTPRGEEADGKGGWTVAYLTCNRGKRDIVVDLKSKAGHELVMALAAKADVFMESNRAGVATRLGIDYAAVKAINPEVVYLSITGFGQSGPYSDRPVTDAIIQAFSGLMTRNLDDTGTPKRIEYAIPDYTTGMNAYQTVVTALLGRERGGGGCHLDVSLMQSLMFFQQHGILQHLADGPYQGTPFPPTGTYRSSDGALNLSVVRERQFKALCNTLGLDTLASDPRFSSLAARLENTAALTGALADAIASRSTASLLKALKAADVPSAKVNSYSDVVADAHVGAVGAVAWSPQPDVGEMPLVNVAGAPPLTPDDARAHAPRFGAHTAQVLGELGLSAARIESLMAEGVVR